MEIYLEKLTGEWNAGYALDVHTTSSKAIKDENGKIRFENNYSEIGELMNKLKYRSELQHATKIAEVAANAMQYYLNTWEIDIIIPIPPSKLDRTFQPVLEIAKALSKNVNLPIDLNGLIKTKPTPQMIGIYDADERRRVLQGVFDVTQNAYTGKDILLIDDLFRSGETLNAATKILQNKGNAHGVYILTITKTRVHK